MNGIYDLAAQVRHHLGPGTDVTIEIDVDALAMMWPTGTIGMTVHDVDDEDAYDQSRFLISYVPHDAFGRSGALQMDYSLPAGTTVTELRDALIHELRWRRHDITPPSPFRWGKTRASVMTDVADQLHDAGFTPTEVRSDAVQVPKPGTRVLGIAMLHPDRQTFVAIGPAVDGFPDTDHSVCRVFSPAAPAHALARTLAYWLQASADDPVPLQDEFPLHRVGLAARDDPALVDLVTHLHRAGLEVLRVDLAFNRDPRENTLPGRDVVTVRDTDAHVLLLSRTPHTTTGWTLHVLAYGADLDAPPIPKPMPPLGADSAPAQVAAAVAQAGRAISDTTDDDVTDEEFLAGPAQFAAPTSMLVTAYMLDDVRERLAAVMRGAFGVDQDKPEPALIRTPHDAEQAAARWMRYLGFDDAQATPIGVDAGIDVTSARAVAQVKTETVPVGRPALQRLVGVAHTASKDALFFSLSGYTSGALEWADAAPRLALFTFDYQGQVEPANDEARDLLHTAGH